MKRPEQISPHETAGYRKTLKRMARRKRRRLPLEETPKVAYRGYSK